MKNQLLLVVAVVSGAVVGRLSGPGAALFPTVQAAVLAQANPPRPPRYRGGKAHSDQVAKKRVKEETGKYQQKNPPTDDTPKAFYINRGVIDSILKQEGCIGLRIYHAYNNTTSPYEPSVVIVGVEKGSTGTVPYQDQVGTYKELSTLAVKEYLVGQTDDRCPSNCMGMGY